MGDLESYQQTASGAECSDSGGSSLPPSPKPAVMWAGSRRKISDSLLVPSRSRPLSRLRAQHSCPESTCTHNCKVQEGQTHTHPPLLHSSTVYYPPLAHQSSVVAAPSTVTAAPPANHATCHCHSEQLELLNQKLAAAEEVNVFHSIPSACAECDDSLPFSGASSIPLCCVLFPATLLHQLFFHPLSPYLAIYFLVYLSILLFPNSYAIPFREFCFLPFSVHAKTNVIYLTLLSLL